MASEGAKFSTEPGVSQYLLLQQAPGASVLLGTWVRAVANNTTTNGTVEAYYLGNDVRVRR